MTEYKQEIESRKDAIHAKKPLLHHISNYVTLSDCANITIAAGGVPIMGDALDEVEEIARSAHALVLNLGTPNKQRVRAMIKAGKTARALEKPIIFDPVGVGVSTARMRWAEKIFTEVEPTIIKGNNGELAALANLAGFHCGVDSLPGYQLPLEKLKELQKTLNAVVVATGATDRVIAKGECISVLHGDLYSTRITGAGCMLSSVIALFAAVGDAPGAAICGLAVFGKAAEDAASKMEGPFQPGTYKARFFDEMALKMHTRATGEWKIQILE